MGEMEVLSAAQVLPIGLRCCWPATASVVSTSEPVILAGHLWSFVPGTQECFLSHAL